jgi:heme/copper-type cytochrome/quinol oxidase subunit 4
MNWTLFDFVFAGGMLACLLLGSVLVLKTQRHWAARLAGGLALVAFFMLVWSAGAVGIIGRSENDANLAYLALPLLALAGAIITRLRPAGLAVTFALIAASQALIGFVAFIAGLGSDGPAWPMDIIVATLIFTALFATSAALFRLAARAQAASSLAR